MKHKYFNINIFRNLRFNLDRLGFCMSSLCAVHCISLPILIVIMPFLAGTWLVNRELEWVFAICSVLFAIGCSAFSSRLHKKYWLPLIAFFGGIILLGAHYTAPDICCSVRQYPDVMWKLCFLNFFKKMCCWRDRIIKDKSQILPTSRF